MSGYDAWQSILVILVSHNLFKYIARYLDFSGLASQKGKMMSTIISDTQRRAHARPRIATIAAIIIALNIYRIAALGLAISVATGGYPAAYMIPGIGDFLAGLTTPIIAFGLWRRRSLTPWLFAIVWLSLSILAHSLGYVFGYSFIAEKQGLWKSSQARYIHYLLGLPATDHNPYSYPRL